MKKLLSVLALGLIIGLSASASIPQIRIEKNNLPLKEIKKAKPAISAEQIKNTPIARKSCGIVKHKIATQEDFCGVYIWSGLDGINDFDKGSLYIEVSPDYPDRMRIYGLDPWIEYVDGYVDNGRLYIPNQYETYYEKLGQEVWFLNYTIFNNGKDDEGNARYSFIRSNKEFYFTLDEEGNIYAGSPLDDDIFASGGYTDAELEEMVCIASSILPYYDPDGDGKLYGFWRCSWIQGSRVRTFEYNKDEWVHVGTAQLREPWFTTWYIEVPTYDVGLYRNKEVNTRFMLMHPFGEGTPWSDVTEGREQGYIVFSIEDPNCVLVEPFVYSLTMPLDVTGEVMEYKTYCYNDEGYQYFINGINTEDIRNAYAMSRKPTSSFDYKTRIVRLYNPRVSIEQNIFKQLYFDPDEFGYLILPEGFLTNVVEAIGVDDITTPEVYYNLQGVKLQAPDKGQVVIVRKGSKTSKIIVK